MMKKSVITIVLSVAISLVIVLTFLLIFNRYDTKKLIRAIKNDDVYTVKTLLEDGVDPNKLDREPGLIWTFMETSAIRPLGVACRNGNYEIVKLLIEYGATAEDIDGAGWSPLRETLFYYHDNDEEIVKLLLEAGADPTFIEDELPVFVAASMTPKVFDKTKSNGTVYSIGYDEECAEGITEIVEMLLPQDADINITTDQNETLLMFAVQNENLYLIEYLLMCGCDINIENSHGKTALDYAVETGNRQLTDMLINHQKSGDGSLIVYSN